MVSQSQVLEINPWLQDPLYIVPEASWTKRDLYYRIQKDLDHHLMLSILGLRRVGKSTIIKQLIALLLERTVDKSRIFYYVFTSKAELVKETDLTNLLDYYLNSIVKEPLHSIKETCYIFLDEIQGVKNWEETLKLYYDISNQKLKFVVSGSQSLLIKDMSSQALAGRIFEFYLTPLSFTEFINIKNETLIGEGFTYKTHLLQSVFDNWIELERTYIMNKLKLHDLAKEYLFYGQFPELQKIPDFARKADYIANSVIKKIVDDLTIFYKIDKYAEFQGLSTHLIKNCGNELELKNLATDLEISVDTVSKYLNYLINGYLFELVYKYHKSGIKKDKMLKKVYNTSANLVVAEERRQYSDLDYFPQIFGHTVENLVFNKLKELGGEIFIWRKGGKEVDFIFKQRDFLTPVEVKFGTNLDKRDLNGILYYCKKTQSNLAIVITKDIMKIVEYNNCKVALIPYSVFLTIKQVVL